VRRWVAAAVPGGCIVRIRASKEGSNGNQDVTFLLSSSRRFAYGLSHVSRVQHVTDHYRFTAFLLALSASYTTMIVERSDIVYHV